MPNKACVRIIISHKPTPDARMVTTGAAGFGLAEFPNLNAVLYNPALPIGQRMSILGNTDIARLYHSEATLLHDGRVLVSGSDPQTKNPDGTDKFPEGRFPKYFLAPFISYCCSLKCCRIPSRSVHPSIPHRWFHPTDIYHPHHGLGIQWSV